MKIYLDTCAFNRPYDKSDELKVLLEARSVLLIQMFIAVGLFDLVASYMLIYECEQSPYRDKRISIEHYIQKFTKCFVGIENKAEIEELAKVIMSSGVKFKDACHLAAAQKAKCDFFITTDKRLLKYKTDEMQILSPTEFFTTKEG